MSSICLSNNDLYAPLTEGFLRLIFESHGLLKGAGFSHGDGARP